MGLLDQYQSRRLEGDLLDYQLVNVHVPKNGKPDVLRATIGRMAYDAAQLFAHRPLELLDPGFSQTPTSPENALFADIGRVHISRHGNIEDPALLASRHAVLVGKNVARCHAEAFQDLVRLGAREVHIPIDGVGHVNDTLFADFDERGRRAVMKGYSQSLGLHRDGISKFRVISRDKDSEVLISEGHPDPVLVVFHETWEQLRNFLREH